MTSRDQNALRVGQFSAYYGDRHTAVQELIASDCEVLTGDYLAELTMLVLRKNQMRGGVGYAEGFLHQVRDNLADIKARGIKLVTNAGGLEPEACATRLRELTAELGIDLDIIAVSGDNQIDSLTELREAGATFANIDTGEILDIDKQPVLTANAYLGAWPIVAALRQGADIVICPRVTDAALVIGAAAWKFDWAADDWDALAGALVAGHVIECGCQATGGNYANFDDFADLGLPGMPIAEIRADGSAVITKSHGSGGVVDIGTVTAQLLYEVGSRYYHNPDVIADLASTELERVGPDRVLVKATKGLPPTAQLKLSLAYEGGYRNQVTIGLTGGRIEQKEAWLRQQVTAAVGAPESFDGFRWTRIGPVTPTAGSYDESTAFIVINAKDKDRGRVSRVNFSDRITQLGTSSIPGFYTFTPPAKERLFGVQWPTLIPKAVVEQAIVLADGTRIGVPWPASGTELPPPDTEPVDDTPVVVAGPVVSTRLDAFIGTRSGDKAGLANLGVWAETDDAFEWLRAFLTVDKLKELLTEARDLTVHRHVFPKLRAMNFLVHGWLEEGVASSTRVDAQAKGLGEFLGSMTVEAPARLVS
ncbi:DUF1446 domain-containing protein [Acrocarpospora macrocephala]|uniref:Exopolyphosphatase n=1 Tax=Acrocarpospora macrocephala TaxID=150177 RepID=A0A5M3X9L2_9ACTN|nr:acyclic terpene utilization AtuA family protein [Acrocarpospora macrocephala]GES14758.1 exopolyphosphatase [Acrocarpospora macrocephala]